jgi:xanthine dehydrogenase accessory factor
MNDWARQALALLEGGRDTVMITVLAAEGSVPRDPGTRMLVTADFIVGTIGGGNLEFRLIDQGRALLGREPGQWRVQDYPLGPLLGQCCGGRVRVLLEHLGEADFPWLNAASTSAASPVWLSTRFESERLVRAFERSGAAATARGPAPSAGDVLCEALGAGWPQVLAFGGGHVGSALERVMRSLPIRFDLFDTRPDLPAAMQLQEAEAVDKVRAASPEVMVLVMTHDHALDYRLVHAALLGRARFVGLIGSSTKRARFVRRLRDEPVDAAALSRLCCPIGIEGIRGKEPEVIAVSAAAQLLMMATQGVAPD